MPIILLDYPDPDIIRVEDTYYMITTTMHFFPGGQILSSKNLLEWHHESYLYGILDDNDQQKLLSNNIYGQGMWAACIRYHQGSFYVIFSANDTQKTYLFKSNQIKGPWSKMTIPGFYHDPSLLFEDDKVYIIYGNSEIKIRELDLATFKPKSNIRTLITGENQYLGYEGSHIYRIGNYYYIFLIHSLESRWKRVQSCFKASNLYGPYEGKIILENDFGYYDQGVAQGGVVQSLDKQWYYFGFQDRFAGGRMPFIIPMDWEEDGFPIVGEKPLKGNNSHLVGDGFLESGFLKSHWQFNHQPDLTSIIFNSINDTIEYKILPSKSFLSARNTLTQRVLFPASASEVTIDASKMQNGAEAGFGILLGNYGYLSIIKEDNIYYIQKRINKIENNEDLGEVVFCEIINNSQVTFRIEVDIDGQIGLARFFIKVDNKYKEIGNTHEFKFKLDHFVGCRFALFSRGESISSGSVIFKNYVYDKGKRHVRL